MEIIKTSAGNLIFDGESFVMYHPSIPLTVAVKDFNYRLDMNTSLNRVVGYGKLQDNDKDNPNIERNG